MARNSVAYEEDFFAWTMDQARLLRSGELTLIDAENVAEELESMGNNNRRELRSRLGVLLLHLLKWRYQPRRKSPSWVVTIRVQRDEIEHLLADSPSLRPVVGEVLAGVYVKARRNAADETRLKITNFPVECPFTEAQIMAEDFLPEA